MRGGSKTLIAMVAALALALALVACGGGSDSSSSSNGTTSAQADTAGGGSSSDAEGESGNGAGQGSSSGSDESGSGSGGGGSGSGSGGGGSGSGGSGSGSGGGAPGAGGGSSGGSGSGGGGGAGGGSATPTQHNDSGGGSAQFKVKGGDNGVQEFGSEASAAEFDAATEALHGYFDARVQRDWAGACRYLAKSLQESSVQLGGQQRSVGCATTLNELFRDVPVEKLREEAQADVGSLRVEGDRGFLLYHGAPHETAYVIAASREDGVWKVASLSGTPLN